MKFSEDYAIARYLASNAYLAMASEAVVAHALGLKILQRAIALDPVAVSDLDKEMDERGMDWEDNFQYPDPMPQKLDEIQNEIKNASNTFPRS